MFRTQIIIFPFHSIVLPVFLSTVNSYIIYPAVQVSVPPQKATLYPFILFILKVTSLALVFIISPFVYCHSLLDGFHLNIEYHFFFRFNEV